MPRPWSCATLMATFCTRPPRQIFSATSVAAPTLPAATPDRSRALCTHAAVQHLAISFDAAMSTAWRIYCHRQELGTQLLDPCQYQHIGSLALTPALGWAAGRRVVFRLERVH